jgi:MacB-like periplasmic core domain
VRDVRYAFRQFLKSPGFAIGAVVSLMLGIGATTTLFSVVYGVLLDPYPYKDANRIVYFELLNKEGRYQPIPVNAGQFDAIRNVSAIEDIFFQQPGLFKNLTGDNSPVAVSAGLYSPNVFIFLGVPPLLGRVFTPSDAPGGNPTPVAVLSFHFWQEHYFGSREVIGKTIELDHAPFTIIGVMPPRFNWFDCDMYLPGKPTADAHDYWMAYPKLKAGTHFPAAEAELQTLVAGFAKEDPDLYGQNPRVRIVALNGDVWGNRGTIASLFAAAVLLLVIGCANASILLLARGAAARVRSANFPRSRPRAARPPTAHGIGSALSERGGARGLGCVVGRECASKDPARRIASARSCHTTQCSGSAVQRHRCRDHGNFLWAVACA